MRDIKFRAWDKPDSRMKLTQGLKIIHGYYDTEVGDTFKLENDSVILMQYTGLLDKSGKEIYEGDIVSVDHHYDGDSRVLAYNDTVIFEEGGFTLKKWFGHDLSMLALNGMCEIIGNIYENPELL